MPVRQRWSELRASEDGAVLVLFALSLVVLFGFSAVAVDAAHAFVERRDSQAAADVAALGGGLALIDASGNAYTKAVTLVDEVMALTERNLGAGLDWENCTDPDRPSKFTQRADVVFVKGIDPQFTECISWSSDFSDIRVRVPQRHVETTFAKVLGFDTFSVGAFAEVGAVTAGGGGVLPFGVLNGDTSGILCLKTGSKFPSECQSNASGNFGFLDFRLFGNSAIPTTARCTGGSVDTLKENIAHGVDHDLATAPSSPIDDKGIDGDPTIVEEAEECPGSKAVQAVLTETGNKTKVIIDGFVDGVNGYPGRLTLGAPTFNYNGTLIDDAGLWEYLTPAAKALCGDPTTESEIVACLAANPGTILFDDSIASSPRLAMVPELWQTTFPNGAKLVSFKDFAFVYVQTLYGGCKNNGTCKLEVEPGASGTKKITSDDPVVVTAIGIGPNNITQTVKDTFGTPSTETYALSR